MDRCTKDNGCLFVYPGSHKKALEPHEKPENGTVNAGFVGIQGLGDEEKTLSGDLPELVWLEMEKGDTVFFHPILYHGSGRNTTTGYRKAISGHFASVNCEYFDTMLDPVQRVRAEHLRKTQARREEKAQYKGDSHIALYRGKFSQTPVLYGAENPSDDTI